MAFEKRWAAIPPTSFTADGGTKAAGTAGLVTVASTIPYHEKQEVVINASGQPSVTGIEVKAVISSTQMYVGPKGNIGARSDLTNYTVANAALIFANMQDRPSIPLNDVNRAIFEEAPASAARAILVDDIGDKYNEDNPLPVDAQIKPVAVFTLPYDSFDADLTGSTQDIYTSYIHGYPPSAGLTPVGTLVQTATINYTDSTKNNIKNVYRTPFT